MDYDFLVKSVSELKCVKNTKELTEVFTQLIQSFGFQQFAYVRLNSEGIKPEESIYTFSEAWRIAYVKKEYHHIDPVFIRTFSETEPFFWSAEQYTHDAKLIAFFEEANRYGIYQGVTISLKSAAKKRAVLTCSSSRLKKPLPISSNQEDMVGLRVLSEVFHQKAIEFSAAYDHLLKPREQQVLTLSALGLISEEIAAMLALHKDYVNEIIANALNRLGGRNRVAVVHRAQELKLLG